MKIQDKDKQITKLFHQGLGARKIAEKLGIKHHASVGKRLTRLGLKRGHCVENPEDLSIDLDTSPKKLRIAAEHYAKFFFILRGYPVFTPEPGAPYDLIVDIDGFKKVQVKSGTQQVPSGNYTFQLRRTRNNTNGCRRSTYSANECDYFFLLDIEGNAWLIPFEQLKDMKAAVTPALRYPGYQVV